MNQSDEFYIGWQSKAPTGIGSTVRKVVVGLFLLFIAGAVLIARSQRMIGTSAFEWGTQKHLSGILQVEPYPHLLVPRPGKIKGVPPFSTYYLVAPWKFGLSRESISPFDGQSVALKGTLIYRGNQTMVETKPEWIQPSTNTERRARSDAPCLNLGRQTLVGEIVDSKCFLGVMNPGQLAPHRACAIRCISGGCPPILVAPRKDGPPLFLLLVSQDGKPVNKQVLDLIAEPVEITGDVERLGELLILRADPSTYHRITN